MNFKQCKINSHYVLIELILQISVSPLRLHWSRSLEQSNDTVRQMLHIIDPGKYSIMNLIFVKFATEIFNYLEVQRPSLKKLVKNS